MTQDGRVLADFIGVWSLRKVITQEGGPDGEFRGSATWRKGVRGLTYHEHGHLRLGDADPIVAERSYVWHPDLTVHFDDGRFFHTVPATGGSTRHWCDPDLYEVMYDFAEWPRFQVVWTVTGPRKNYRMACQYDGHRPGTPDRTNPCSNSR